MDYEKPKRVCVMTKRTGIQNQQNVPVVRLLRCRKTQRYFTGQGWSDNPACAEKFQEQLAAVRACLAHKLDNMELVLRHDGGQTDLFCTVVC